MKAPKTAGLLLGAAFALLVAAAVALAPRLEETVKARLADAASEKTGRRLSIDGLELSFGAALGVQATGITLSERTGDAPFATLASVRVALAWLPLLSRRIGAEALELTGLHATVRRRADGTLNIDDLLALRGDGSAPGLDIGAVHLADAQLTWQDEGTGRRLALSALELRTGRIAPAAAGEFELAARMAAPGADGAALRVAGHYRLDLERQALAVERLEARLEARPALDARLALAGAEITAAALAAEKIELEVDVRRDEARLAARIAGPLSASFASGTLELPRLAGELGVTLPARLKQPLRLPVTGTLAADWRRPQAELALAGRLEEATFSARATATRFALDIDRVDADRYLVAAGTAGARGPAPRPAPSALDQLDIAGTVSISRLNFARVEANDVRLRLGRPGGEGS